MCTAKQRLQYDGTCIACPDYTKGDPTGKGCIGDPSCGKHKLDGTCDTCADHFKWDVGTSACAQVACLVATGNWINKAGFCVPCPSGFARETLTSCRGVKEKAFAAKLIGGSACTDKQKIVNNYNRQAGACVRNTGTDAALDKESALASTDADCAKLCDADYHCFGYHHIAATSVCWKWRLNGNVKGATGTGTCAVHEYKCEACPDYWHRNPTDADRC